MQGKQPDIAVFWFRRDLRLEDNHGLFQALSNNPRVLPIFIFDRNILDVLRDQQDKRVAFIYRHIQELHQRLAEMGASLWTFYGAPLEAFETLCRDFEITAVYANHDYEPYARERDGAVREFLHTHSIELHTYKDQCIFEKEEILNNSGRPYTVFTPYKRKWLSSLEDWQLASFATETHYPSLLKTSPFPLVALEEMGFKDPGFEFPSPQPDEAALADYHLTRDLPGLDTTSRLGVHLRFGTLSIRRLCRLARDLNDTWLSELIWREFFMQILFHFPRVVDAPFRPDYDRIQWRNDSNEFERWRQGRTGYPIVDAGMRQLNQTGFMHNRVRMITASFLCKHLLIDWRWGEAYFAAKLLDYDLSANNGNWQWAAGTGCDAAPYFRVFNPWTQAQKFDKDMTYIKQWVPELLQPDYPSPMVDHGFARKRALAAYKAALENKETPPHEPEAPLFPDGD